LGFITPSYAQVKTLKNPVQTTNRTGDGTAPISSETKDSPTLLSDIAAAYDRMEQSIELAYNNLKKDNRSTIDHLNDQIEELNAMTKKREALLKKMLLLEQIMQQLEQEKQNGMQNLKEQKRKAIQQANELIKQKRSRDLQVFSQTIKIQMVKAGQDSLLSISRRYQVHQ
jgi:hypothetical protein